MGAPATEPGVKANEQPAHYVTLTHAYCAKVTEVTQGEWKTLAAANPSHFTSCGDNCPVELRWLVLRKSAAAATP